MLCHVVISCETFWMPTRFLSLGKGNMVQRKPGAVYYYAPGQSICVCYGRITESPKVNQLGRVLKEDFDDLQATEKLVYQETATNKNPTIVRIEVSLIGGDGDMGLVRELNLPLPVSAAPTEDPVVWKYHRIESLTGPGGAFKTHGTAAPRLTARKPKAANHWRVVKARIEKKIDEVWSEEPDEFRKLRLGVVESGVETGGQSFSVLVHLEAYLMMDGADIVYRVLQLTQGMLTVPDITHIARIFLTQTFNHFELLSDLGLPSLRRAGEEYSKALDTVTNKEEFVELTGALLIYLTRMHRWIHLIFPWHLGAHFPHRDPGDVVGFPKLPI